MSKRCVLENGFHSIDGTPVVWWVKELAGTLLRDYASPRLKDAARYRKAYHTAATHAFGRKPRGPFS